MKARPKNPARPDQTGTPSARSAAAPTAAAPDLTRSSPAPELDVKEYRKMLSDLDLESIEHRLNKAIKRSNDAAAAAAAEITQSGIIPQAFEKDMFDSLQELIEIAKWAKSMQELLTPELQRLLDLRETLESPNWKTFIECVRAGEEKINALEPFLEAELPAIRTHPGYESATLEDIESFLGLDGQTIAETIGGQPIPPFIRDAIERAIQRMAAFDAGEGTLPEPERAAAEFPSIHQYKKTTDFKTTTDKLANVFFSLAAPQPNDTAINGQRQMIPLKYESGKSKKEITLFYDYVYNEDVLRKHGLDMKFDDFDYFIASTSDNLYTAGNDIVSVTRFFYEMGWTGSPTTKQLDQIYGSLLKGLSTIITIDDEEVQKSWGNKTGTFHEIVSPVIPVQLFGEKFVANGKITNCYIKINGLSPFMQVAKPLGHITAWEKDVLRLYSGRRTKRYYSVMRFLMQQIGWMRNNNSNRNHKILYSSLYKYTGDETARAQQLTRDMMYRLLDEVFKATDYISAYKEEATPTPGVVLTLNRNRLNPARK